MTQIREGGVEIPAVTQALGTMLREQEVWADEYRLMTCGPTTGHFVKIIALCDNAEIATILAAALAPTPSPEIAEQPMGELERGKDELRRLMDSIWRAEFYKDAPNWQPLDDLPGMVSQIDHLYASVRNQRDQARWDLHNPPRDVA